MLTLTQILIGAGLFILWTALCVGTTLLLNRYNRRERVALLARANDQHRHTAKRMLNH